MASQLRISAGPQFEMQDSGWNCTPCNRQVPVIKGHDVSRFIVRTCNQLFGHRVRIDDPRMVASYDQGRSDFLQQQIARIGYGQRRRMSVQRGRQLSQFGTECPGER